MAAGDIEMNRYDFATRAPSLPVVSAPRITHGCMDLRAATCTAARFRRPKPSVNLKLVSCGTVSPMADSNEIEALKASMRGVRRSAEALTELAPRVDSLDSRAEIEDADLEALQRLSLAHAVAAQALRGLVEAMLRRRGKLVEETAGASGGGDE